MIDKRYYEKLGGFAYLLGELRKKLGREQTDVLVNDAVTLCKGTDFELPFLLAVWLGLRTSEIIGLTWDCLDGDILTIKQAMVDGEDGPQLKQPKTYSGNRKLKVPPYIMGCLTKHRTQMSILSMQPEMSCISICKSRVLTEDNLQISQVMRKQVSQKALANTRKTPQPLRLRGFLLSGGFNSDIWESHLSFRLASDDSRIGITTTVENNSNLSLYPWVCENHPIYLSSLLKFDRPINQKHNKKI